MNDGALSQRQALAAAFHIAVEHGWGQLVYNHFTARVPDKDAFLVHPFGLLFSEVSASCLMEVDLHTGALVEQRQERGEDMPYNATSYVLHSCIYHHRPDVACVLHVHVPCIVAVASSTTGLKVGLSQESCLIGPVAYHDYEGIATSMEEQARVVSNLGSTSNVLFLRNHGVICCGTSVAHALSVLYHVWRACQVQCELGAQSCHLPPPSIVRDACSTHANFTKTGNHNLEFKAMLRLLKRKNNLLYLE